MYSWLVVWNIFCFSMYREQSSQVTSSYFSEGFKPPTIVIILPRGSADRWYWSNGRMMRWENLHETYRCFFNKSCDFSQLIIRTMVKRLKCWNSDWRMWEKLEGEKRAEHEFTLWLFNIAMENGPFIDDFPNTSIYKGFSMAMLVITRW